MQHWKERKSLRQKPTGKVFDQEFMSLKIKVPDKKDGKVTKNRQEILRQLEVVEKALAKKQKKQAVPST